MNTRGIIGIVMVVLGILVLIFPILLPIVVAIALIIGGLWLVMQNVQTTSNI